MPELTPQYDHYASYAGYTLIIYLTDFQPVFFIFTMWEQQHLQEVFPHERSQVPHVTSFTTSQLDYAAVDEEFISVMIFSGMLTAGV